MTIRRAILSALIAVTLLALPIQFVIDPSAQNMASVCIVVASALSVLLYMGWSRALESQPLSTFAILGFCVTTQLGALVVQTVAWTALRSSLYDPLYTFGVLAFYQGIALSVHIVYRFFSRPDTREAPLFRGLLNWMGLYRTPPCGTLWFMGCVGLVSFFVSHQIGVVGRIGNGFNFLTWAPFLIPFYLREEGEAYCNAKRNKLMLVVYTAAVAILGLGLNAREIVFVGVVTIGLLYFLAGLRSDAPMTRRTFLRLAALAAALIAVSGPFSDLATSMAIVRGSRGKISASEMIRSTLRVMRQPRVIDAYRAENGPGARYKAYDEHYIANPVIARFVSTKFHDNALHFAKALSTDDAKARLRDVTIQETWAVLPTPLLDMLGIGIAKEDMDYSMGDYLAYLSRGLPLGGRKTGSMFAQGIALMGPLFPIAYAAICLALFWAMNLLTTRKKATVSALGMLEIWSYFSAGISAEALPNILNFLIRGFAQMVLIYVLVFGLARLVLRTKNPPAEVSDALTWQRPI